jgi:hypothetical protein
MERAAVEDLQEEDKDWDSDCCLKVLVEGAEVDGGSTYING